MAFLHFFSSRAGFISSAFKQADVGLWTVVSYSTVRTTTGERLSSGVERVKLRLKRGLMINSIVGALISLLYSAMPST